MYYKKMIQQSSWCHLTRKILSNCMPVCVISSRS